jgi:myosin heavy chain 9/10/11/14
MKKLNVRIVDLETKSLNSPRPVATSRRLESRIEELTSQLHQSTKDTSKVSRSADKSARDAKLQLAESDRARARLEEEVKNYEGKLAGLRQSMDELVSDLYFSSNNLLIISPANIRA